MRSAATIVALLCLLAAPAWAGNEVTIQPDETFPWACEMYATLAAVNTVTVTQLDGSDDLTPATLVSDAQVNPGDTSQVLFQLRPAGKADAVVKKRVYQAHIVARDSNVCVGGADAGDPCTVDADCTGGTCGNKYACDGRVNVEVKVLEW